MALGVYIPNVPLQLLTDAGVPASGYKLYSYLSGTTTKTSTFTTSALSVANSNPVTLDSAGRATVFLDPSVIYKFVLATPTDTDPPASPIWTRDGISLLSGAVASSVLGTAGENLTAGQAVYLSNGSGSLTAGRWYKTDSDFSYASTLAGATGFAVGSFNTGVVGAIQLSGQVTGLSGLTAGVNYYIGPTAGALTATAPGNAFVMGMADSTTSLIINHGSGSSAAQSIGTVNLLADPTFLIWAAGDTSVPSHYAGGGTGSSFARCGTGLADTNRKVGDFCIRVGASGAGTVTFGQYPLALNTFSRYDFLRGQSVSLGVWCLTSLSSTSVALADGVSSSGVSIPNTGVWTWVTLTRTIDAAATYVNMLFTMNAGSSGNLYISGPTVVFGPTPPASYQPAPVRYIERTFHIYGAVTAAANKTSFSFARPGIVKDVQLECITAPTGQALIADVNTWDGAAYTSMFSTRPQIADGATAGGAQPDSTYARRCFKNMSGASFAAGSSMRIDIDQVGSGAAGSDLEVMIRYLTYERVSEEATDYNNIGGA